jgi:hypothetical protein
MEPTDIDPTITRYVSDWLGSLGEEDGFERLEELIPLDDDEQDEDEERPDLSVLGDLEHALVYSSGWSTRWLLLPRGEWSWASIPAKGELLAISDRGSAFRGTVKAFAADKTMWVEREPWIIANDPPAWSAWPFPFAGDDWDGTQVDRAFGESEWIVHINGDEDSFDLESRRLVFTTSTHASPGTYLEIETDGYSMSTGEIGTTVNVDVDGGLFASSWGYITAFHGHADPAITLEEVFELADPENLGFTAVCRVTSEVYTRQQMLTVVKSILSDASEEDYEEIDIQCSDWSGTAAEFFAEH